nr:DUF2381 family protein [Corallococcus terminator]
MLFAAPAGAQPAAAQAQTSAPAQREMRSRELIINDENANTLHEIHVAGGAPTSLVLPQPLADQGGAILAAPPDIIPTPSRVPASATRLLVLSPAKDVPAGKSFPLTLTFADGTVQSFRLVTVAEEVDIQIAVKLQMQAKASAASAPALTAAINSLRAQLDECQATSDVAGTARIAALVLRQDLDKPQAFTAERRNVRHRDKQSRLLVEARAVYRLFGQSFLVLGVQNRDASANWQMEKAEIAVSGGSSSQDAKVLSAQMDVLSLPPDETARVVIAFETPAQGADQRYLIRLFERGGNRHVELTDVQL